jgi:hypothetical protein
MEQHMDLNYLCHRHQISLFMADAFRWRGYCYSVACDALDAAKRNAK